MVGILKSYTDSCGVAVYFRLWKWSYIMQVGELDGFQANLIGSFDSDYLLALLSYPLSLVFESIPTLLDMDLSTTIFLWRKIG